MEVKNWAENTISDLKTFQEHLPVKKAVRKSGLLFCFLSD